MSFTPKTLGNNDTMRVYYNQNSWFDLNQYSENLINISNK